jgi:hypothetical protein
MYSTAMRRITRSRLAPQRLPEKNAKTPYPICTFMIKQRVRDLAEAKQTAALCELDLIFAKISPMSEL